MAEQTPQVEPIGPDGLTARQRRFVDALVGPCRGNATASARLAGYHGSDEVIATTASENLRKPKVQEALRLALAKERMSPEWAKAGLLDIAAATIDQFLDKDEQGQWRIDLDKASEAGAMGQVHEYTEDEIPQAGGGIIIKRRIKLHDRAKALGILLKLHGLLVEKQELSGPGGKPIQTETQAKVDYDNLSPEELIQLRNLMLKAAGQTPNDKAGA